MEMRASQGRMIKEAFRVEGQPIGELNGKEAACLGGREAEGTTKAKDSKSELFWVCQRVRDCKCAGGKMHK